MFFSARYPGRDAFTLQRIGDRAFDFLDQCPAVAPGPPNGLADAFRAQRIDSCKGQVFHLDSNGMHP